MADSDHIPLTFNVESLERRTMLAGVVSATINSSGLLGIDGDASANQLDITYDNDRNFRLVAEQGTLISWEDQLVQVVDVSNVSGLQIRLGAGDDRVALTGTHAASLDSLRINAGAGDDELRLKFVHADGPSLIYGAGGSDQVISSGTRIGNQFEYVGGAGLDFLLAKDLYTHRGFEDANAILALTIDQPDFNTSAIERVLGTGATVMVPAGTFPVRPISVPSHSRLVGQGVGASELRLEIDAPERFDPQHVISTAVPTNRFTTDVVVSDLTLNGNYENIDWDGVYGDGNAFGLYVRAADNSLFTNLEIKNTWTDGIYVSTVLGQNNNTQDTLFENIDIHHAGRQGVSVVGGQRLTFDNFNVSSIGRDGQLHTSPRSAIDLEPEFNVRRLVRNITISNWDISRTGQGVLISATHSSREARNITVENVHCDDLDGPQILAARDVKGLTVETFSCSNHNTNAGVGVLFSNTTGTVDGLTLTNLVGSHFALRFDGTTNVVLNDVVVDGTSGSVLSVGGEPSQELQRTRVELSSFEFNNVGNLDWLSAIRVNSSGFVKFEDGNINNVGVAPYTFQLFTNAVFSDVEISDGVFGTFDPARIGSAIGYEVQSDGSQ